LLDGGRGLINTRIKWLKRENNEVADALSRMKQKDEEKTSDESNRV